MSDGTGGATTGVAGAYDDTGTHDDAPMAAVAGIGASAGGLAALRTLFENTPADTGVAWVVVVHLSPEHESHLPELLQPSVRMPVQQVTEPVRIEPNRVYIIPPNRNLESVDTHLRLSDLAESRSKRAPIDHFFRTLAKTHDGHAVAVVLTGTGSDGTLGVKEIKERGGLAIAQDPEEAEYDGMPLSAMDTGMVDLVLPLAKIPAAVARFARTRPSLPRVRTGEDLSEDDTKTLQSVFSQVRARTGRDFGRYKRSTMLRRIARRMQIHRMERFSDYLAMLRADEAEVRALSDDLLITVTSFFRDEEAYDALETKVVPELFAHKDSDDSIRVWSVGCATGEEAYSVAILLLEAAEAMRDAPRIQVFASDLHERSLATAREGYYPGDIEIDVSSGRLGRWFRREDGGYRVADVVREAVVFAPHNLLTDPPFSRLDLIVCRNLLIYLERDVQKDVTDLFHYALKLDGFLVLGTAETLEGGALFRTVDKREVIYRKRNVMPLEPRLPVFPLTKVPYGMTAFAGGGRRSRGGDAAGPTGMGALHERLAERFAPPSILVSPDDKVVHTSEHAGRYLVHPGGAPTQSAFKIVRPELRAELRAGLTESRQRPAPVETKFLPVLLEGEPREVLMHVRAEPDVGADGADWAGFALVVFVEREPDDPGDAPPAEAADGGELQAELDRTRKLLQGVISEDESGREELRASNEELQSANEELRSTLEELETSKEELQSMNEELQTVNQENRLKVVELAQLSGDLQNLLEATDIATLFLDKNMRILRFTPQLAELFNIRGPDRGRPLSDLTHRLDYDELISDAERVLESLIPIEREIASDDRWFLVRVRPYRSTSDHIEGVVITFIDTSKRRQAEADVRRSERRFRALVEASASMVWTTDSEGRVVEDSPSWRAFTGQTVDAWMGWGWLDAVHPRDRPRVEAAWRDALARAEPLATEFRVRHAPSGDFRWTSVRAVPLEAADGAIEGWVGMNIDIQSQKRAEQELRGAKAKLEERVRQVRSLAADLAAAEQHERTRIAQVLHDDVQQILHALKIRIHALADAEDPTAAEDRLQQAEELLAGAVRALRTLTMEINPSVLREKGLGKALEWLAQHMREHHGLHVDLDYAIEGDEDFGKGRRIMLFHCIRELLFNVVKHARVDRAGLQARIDDGRLVVELHDSGAGFDVDQTLDRADAGVGLKNIGERLRVIDGGMQLTSSPGGGTRVVLSMPVDPDELPETTPPGASWEVGPAA